RLEPIVEFERMRNPAAESRAADIVSGQRRELGGRWPAAHAIEKIDSARKLRTDPVRHSGAADGAKDAPLDSRRHERPERRAKRRARTGGIRSQIRATQTARE